MKSLLMMVSGFMLSGCFYGTYKPNMQSAPSFKKQGDWMVGFTMQNAQVGYAHGKKWATVLNGYYFQGELPTITDGNTSNYERQSHLLEVGLCRYLIQKENRAMYLMGGAGWGYADFKFSQSGPISIGIGGRRGGNAHFNKYFFQQAFSFDRKRTQFLFSYRLAFVHFRDYNDYYDYNNYRSRLQESPVFFEPALTWKREFKRGGFWYQLQYSLALNDGAGFEHHVYRSMPTLHAGLYLHMQKRDSKK